MNKTELQDLLDKKFPSGAQVFLSQRDVDDPFPETYGILTPRIMVLTDKFAMFFSALSRKDFALTIGDVEEKDGRVILRSAFGGADVEIEDAPQDQKKALAQEREIFGDERLEQMRASEE